ncbi:ATP-binding cassette domain-containing protein [Derxia gummosa]|uniref:ATP-binding cassette domain-containing protein n=1 Tax=Derxia gummosa DSM 723 TaxID=1121388 RepID=A0A8B6X9R7_9BURK|nr:ATP-binding cassette domain-containing protein [Derxia gummosa]
MRPPVAASGAQTEGTPPDAAQGGDSHHRRATDIPGDDPLIIALLWLCRHHGMERSGAALLDGIAVSGRLRPAQALAALRNAGFSAGLVRRAPRDILSLLLPALLFMKSGEVVAITRRLDQREPAFEILLPASGIARIATEAELLADYAGSALLATPRPAGQRAPAGGDSLLLAPGQHWLWGTLKRYSPYYRSAMLAALITNVLMLVSGFFTSVVYDRVIPHEAFVTLYSLAVGALLATGFDLAARQLRSHLIDHAGKKADLALGSLLFRQTLGIRLEHKPESAGAFAHQVAQIETVRDFSASATLSALSDLPFVALFIAVTFFIAGPLAWVLVVSVPLVGGLCWITQRMLARHMRANQVEQAALHGVLIEAVEGLEEVRAAGAQAHFLKRYEEANAAAAASALGARGLSSWVNNIAGMSQQLVTLVMLVWGVHLIHDGVITGGALIGAVMFAGRAIAPLGGVVALATRYQGAKAALVMLDQLMCLPTERAPDRSYLARPDIRGELALKDVSFAYPARRGGGHAGAAAGMAASAFGAAGAAGFGAGGATGAAGGLGGLPGAAGRHAPTVLRDVSLDIRAGERVAILGKIGSGKSTLLRLLAGLYQPTAGTVLVDGLDLRQIDPADFRAQTGFVAQEPRLFHGTLRENVFMGRANIDAGWFQQVARQTGLDRLAAAHPLGWDLPVGEMGGLLSGGQRQLVALARCLVTRPRVLLMDEPTSSMDAQAEMDFIRQLGATVDGRTLVVVTHRPALLALVDRIVVVEAGKVVLDGSKAEVLATLQAQQTAMAGSATPGRVTTAEAAQVARAMPAQVAAQASARIEAMPEQAAMPARAATSAQAVPTADGTVATAPVTPVTPETPTPATTTAAAPDPATAAAEALRRRVMAELTRRAQAAAAQTANAAPAAQPARPEQPPQAAQAASAQPTP